MWIVDLLAPRSCAFCAVPSEGDEKNICNGCFLDLPWNNAPLSPSADIFECSIAMMHYSFPVDVAIKAMKYNRKLFYAAALAEILCTATPLLADDVDAILPVPLHWRRKAWRGFNQAEELTGPLARHLNLPVVRDVRRHKATPFQSGLGAVERARNLRGAFRVRKDLGFAHVLIVDDVVTTGATMHQLGKILQQHGVRKISTLAVARAKLLD